MLSRRCAIRSQSLACFLLVLAGGFATGHANESVLEPSTSLYVDRESDIALTVRSLKGKEQQTAATLAAHPIATWFSGGSPAEVRTKIASLAREATNSNRVPVIVAYNIPF